MPFLSHYGGVPDQSNRLSLPALVFLVLTPLVVAARLTTRFRGRHLLQPDDWIIGAATLFALMLGVLMIVCCHLGFGKHSTDIEPIFVQRTLKYFFLSQIVYKMSISFTKLSILCFYRRLFYVQAPFRKTCEILLAVVLCWILAAFFATVFQCTPVAFAYDKRAGGGHGSCINLKASWYANAAFNIASDFVITLLPVSVIRSLQMRTREKVMLCGLFALGFLVCGTSILRATTINLAGSSVDRTWHSVNSSMWSVYEANLAVIGSCMPILKKPITRILHISTKKASELSRSGTVNITAESAPTDIKDGGRSSKLGWRTSSKEDRVDSSSEEDAPPANLELFSITHTREWYLTSEPGTPSPTHDAAEPRVHM